ncbi:hypothetical protein V6Z98_010184 [Aspergillus fumigatus]
MGFRSQIPNKFRDTRHLYIEYYKPRPRAIVHAEFRAVFLKRMWGGTALFGLLLRRK